MNYRLLGIIAIIGAPFLFIDFLMYNLDGTYHPNSVSGVFNLIYITAWTCSIIGLWKARATGSNRWAKIVLIVQLVFLSLANCWNIYLIIDPGADTALYKILDLFWPISNLWMLATGITVAVAKVFEGWKRFVPMIVGLWLPLSIAFMSAIFNQSRWGMVIGGIYSVLAWSLLGLVIITEKKLYSISTNK